MNRWWTTFAAACVLGTMLIILGCRWFGPHDLYEKDQPKTMAYTADMLVHGRLALPRDMIYQPATKPPMYNWIGAAVIRVTGVWNEWTLKFPSVLGTFITAAIVFAMARRLSARRTEATLVGMLAVGIWFTFGSDVRHASVLRLSYLARPDMLLTAFCTAAWLFFTIAAERARSRRSFVPAMAAWACVAAAALTKGPAAALPAVFGIVYAGLCARRSPSHALPPIDVRQKWDPFISYFALGRAWPVLGTVIVAAAVLNWLAAAARYDINHVLDVILKAEVTGRISQTPEGFRSPWYFSLMWFVTKAWPWGAVAIVGLVLTAWLPRLRRTAGPAALYLAIVLIGLSLPAAKRMDYLLPAFAPAAVLVASLIADVVRHRVLGVGLLLAAPIVVGVVLTGKRVAGADLALPAAVVGAALFCLLIERRRAVPVGLIAILPLLLATIVARAHLRRSLEAANHWSNNAVAFIGDVRRIVPADKKVLVLVRGKHPLVTLLGRHQGSYLTPADLASADYVILPQQPDLRPMLLSEPLPVGFDVVESRELNRLGLYRDVPNIFTLIAAQKACGEWTQTENPYHAPGTVFRDE